MVAQTINNTLLECQNWISRSWNKYKNQNIFVVKLVKYGILYKDILTFLNFDYRDAFYNMYLVVIWISILYMSFVAWPTNRQMRKHIKEIICKIYMRCLFSLVYCTIFVCFVTYGCCQPYFLFYYLCFCAGYGCRHPCV